MASNEHRGNRVYGPYGSLKKEELWAGRIDQGLPAYDDRDWRISQVNAPRIVQIFPGINLIRKR